MTSKPFVCGQKARRCADSVGIVRGAALPYAEAVRLGVIDARVRDLVACFNVDSLVASVASCEGHGFPWRYTSPYVAFKARNEIAASLHALLDADGISARPRLSYFWSIEAHFDPAGELVYRLAIPGIEQYRLVTRGSLDRDFATLASMVQKAVDKGDHLARSQDAGIKTRAKHEHHDGNDGKQNILPPLRCALRTKRVIRITSPAMGRGFAQGLFAVDTLVQGHLSFSSKVFGPGTFNPSMRPFGQATNVNLYARRIQIGGAA